MSGTSALFTLPSRLRSTGRICSCSKAEIGLDDVVVLPLGRAVEIDIVAARAVAVERLPVRTPACVT